MCLYVYVSVYLCVCVVCVCVYVCVYVCECMCVSVYVCVCVCVFYALVIQHAMRISRIVICVLLGSTAFLHFKKGTIFKQKLSYCT